jgi:RNA polymerase sigma-70 factor (ECF subfamily)
MTNTNDNDFRNQIVALLPRMRRFAYTLTSNIEDADDLVQTACERALSRRHQWQPGTRLDKWIFRIIYTKRIDMTRLKRSRSIHVSLDERSCISNSDGGNNKIEANIMLGEVLQAMGQLSDRDRAVLALVCIEGQSYKDSASILDVPIGTVMSRLARARKRLYDLVYNKGKFA